MFSRIGLAMIIYGIVAYLLSPALAQGLGTISDGSCSCKTRCDGGNSLFSAGRTVAQCRSMCVRAFSGCTRGEIRSSQRRDIAAIGVVGGRGSIRPPRRTVAAAGTPTERAYQICRAQLRGIGHGRGAEVRRFHQLEHCAQGKLSRR
jgi:hypothetical protein